MSNLLLLASAALAQTADCLPDPNSLVALPAPGATDVAIDIVPRILFNDPCDTELVITVAAADDGIPLIADSFDTVREYGLLWGLDSNSTYTVSIADSIGVLLVEWDFETGDRVAESSSSPSALMFNTWTEEIDGVTYQAVDYVIEPTGPRDRIVRIKDGEDVLFVTNLHDTRSLVASEPLRYRVAYPEAQICLKLVETDEAGVNLDNRFCQPNGDPPEAFDTGCSTSPVGLVLGWLPLALLTRRR